MKQNRILLWLFSVVILLGGCFISRPPNNSAFGSIETTRDLEGVYQNIGEGKPENRPIYLSTLIWPKDKEINHNKIETIEVRVVSDNTIIIRALGRPDVGIIKEEKFIEGKDFEIHFGRIRLRQSVGFSGSKLGDPIVGPTYEDVELGLDIEGQGKYKDNYSVVGLVYLVLPVAMSESNEVRFVRIGK
jgi:hypothetical protein